MKQQILASIPKNYSPLKHFLVPALIGWSLIILSFLNLSSVFWLSWLTIPLTIFILFGFEWVVHKHILHQRRWGLSELFIKHEQMHHCLYHQHRMALSNYRELYLILMPVYAILLVFGLLVPPFMLLFWLWSTNVAWLMLGTAMAYFLAYEWLHCCYHLPANHWLGRNRLIVYLRKLHASHHHPAHMKHWNFNVTVPVFDRLLGTYRKD